MKGRFVKRVFDRYMRWRLAELLAPAQVIELEYALDAKPRYGFGLPPHLRLAAAIGEGRERYAETLRRFLQFAVPLARISRADPGTLAPAEPTWNNRFYGGLDAVALYGFLSLRNPSNYFEIGSGHSTRFARRAIVDQGLRTTITSCDPAPRAQIDDLCDRTIRAGVETVDLAVFDELAAGDILFIDNSHRSFMNSDATVVFLDVLPRLKAGTLVHLHDIFLPYDYPATWADRHYSEQYLLACGLLAGGANMNIVMPNAFVGRDPDLAAVIAPFWEQPGMRQLCDDYCAITSGFQGVSFWFEVR
jgi:hypothetical protein